MNARGTVEMTPPTSQHVSEPSEVHVIDIEADIDNIINIVDDVAPDNQIKKVPDNPVAPVMNGNGKCIDNLDTCLYNNQIYTYGIL